MSVLLNIRFIIVCGVLSLLFLSASAALFLHYTGISKIFWVKSPLVDIQSEKGFAYTVYVGTRWAGTHIIVEHHATVLENGLQLPHAHSSIEDIRAKGNGRFLFSQNPLYFSTTDNTDPRTNGRGYEVYLPRPVSKILIFGLLCATIFSGTIFLFLWIMYCSEKRNFYDLVKKAREPIVLFLIVWIIPLFLLLTLPPLWGSADSVVLMAYLILPGGGVIPHFPPLYPLFTRIVNYIVVHFVYLLETVTKKHIIV